ncbi:flagellar hook-associated protein FlgL [Sphaerotilus sp.]|uniref:flagellar hook-associated protein FlgL n=1 Tax=Sphaerotilus sp. TaxID=2093942 RepID=UPI00286E9410|nr:flagellar hook-associated protein FlgL [Sphaerotilus sp.]
MTRVASALSQQTGLNSLMRRQQDLVRSQERMVSGKRIERASDDPAGAARAERALADQTRSEGLLRTVGASRNAMSVVESSIGDAVDLVQTAREAVVEAGNGAFNTADRALLADRLKQIKGQLLSMANTDDGAGHFVFGGQGSDRLPFVDSGVGVEFQGTSGKVDGSLSEDLPLAVDGDALWLKARTGNGVFETDRQVAPTSTAWISAGQVSDPSALTLTEGQRYEVSFTTATRYSVSLVASDGSSTPFPDAANSSHDFVSGTPITGLPGMSVGISGTAVAGDTFTIEPSSPNLSVFDALDRVIDVLGSSATVAPNAGDRAQVINHGLRDLDQVLGNLQVVRSRSGETLNRLDGLDARTQDRVLSDKATRSEAEDLDMTQGISDFSTKQSAYQAALQSYSMVRKLSLFDYISN